jgi:putative hydrolase of the HAD superfamily
MIKAIIWDMGGVLTRREDDSWRRRWEAQLELLPGQLVEIVFSSHQAALGEITPEEAWNDVGETLELSPEELTTLREDFRKGVAWDVDLFDYIQSSLKGRYKLGVLSDAWLGTRDNVQEWINYDVFDVIMFSAEEGVRKPDPAMYQRMLSRLGVDAKEAIFIDDRANNVDGARALGMYGIHYTPEIDIKTTIEKIAS